MRRLLPAGMPGRGSAPAAALFLALALGAGGCGPGVPGPSVTATRGPSSGATSAAPPTGTVALPRPAHTVVVVMENHSYSDIIGSPQAPYLNSLARRGALLTNSHAVTHPSEPNYLALFSGSTQGLADDSCPHTFRAANLGSELIGAHLSFAGYSEGLPATASSTCEAGNYARKHVPWANFPNVPASANKPFTAFPAGNYARLPTVSFVIPDLCHDMHDCPAGAGDAWIARHLSGYADWAMSHRSLLIVTWDEDDGSAGNHIATIIAGQQVRPGRYGRPVSHYGLLRTIEQLYGLAPTGAAAQARVITGIWR